MPSENPEVLKMIAESRLIEPPVEKQRETPPGSSRAFQKLLEDSWKNPDGFWEQVARELVWARPWDAVREGDLPETYDSPGFRYFVGGEMNVSVNLLDRHIENGAGNRLALIWEGENYDTRFFTYAMLRQEVNRFCNVLRQLGLRKGDRMAIFMPNCPEVVIAVLAAYRSGIVFNTIFSGFSSRSLRDRLVHFEPALVVTSDGFYRRKNVVELKSKLDTIVSEIPSIQHVVVTRRVGSAVTMQTGRDHVWDDLMSQADTQFDPVPCEANAPGLVFYTSGTTGKPKGVVHSGAGFLVNNYVWTRYHLAFHPQDVFWCAADIGWLTMHIWGIIGALSNGTTTVFYEGSLDTPAIDHFYQIIEKYRVTKLFTAPTAVRLLMKHGDVYPRKYDLSSLSVMSFVGEPLNPEAWEWAYKHLGNEKTCLNNTWGQTETAGTPLSGAAWLTPMKPGSCGVQFLGVQVEIVDDMGQPVPDGTPGNLVIRSPFPMLVRTLWRDHKRYIDDYFSRLRGAYFTYDEAVRDADGHFWVLGRTDDVINVSGHRLSTMEIESAIIKASPDIAEAAVIAAPDKVKGSVPVAFVTVRQGAEASPRLAKQIEQAIDQEIGKIARSEQIYFVDTMPKTPSGKIMRRILKEVVVTGEVRSDLTGLEDPQSVEHIKERMKQKL